MSRLTIQLAVREIERYAGDLIDLLESLPEDLLWSKEGDIPNSIGTLARHLTGNLNHYFGAGLLKNGYVREREKEFSETGMARQKLASDLREAVQITKKAIELIDETQANQPYRTPCGQEFETLSYHVVRLATHFAHHCGQADYAQRYVRKD